MAAVTPGSHAAWQAEARRLFGRIPALLAHHGVARAPDVRLLDDATAMYSYYDLRRRVICASLPDVTTPTGRLFWLFLTGLLGVPSETEALAFGRWLLVYVLGHETGHHLRHHYGAYTADRWLEEHVANELGFGLAVLFPGFRRQLPAMTPLVTGAAERLASFGGAHVTWAHRDVGEVLVATGVVTEDAWRQARRLARETGQRPEVVLEAAGLRHDAVLRAERERTDAAEHLRRDYLSDLVEYGAFHLTWLADLLRKPEPPDLGASVAAHLLTPDWEDRRRHAVRLFLRRTVTADAFAAAGAATVLARDEGAAAADWLATAFPTRTPAVQAAILRALAPLPAMPAMVAACGRILATGPGDGSTEGPGGDLLAAASLYLLRHQPDVLRSRAAASIWGALAARAGSPGVGATPGGLPAALAAVPALTLKALGEVVAIVPGCLDGLQLGAWIQPLLRNEAAAVRIDALRLLGEPAVAWPGAGLAQDVASLAGSRHAGERRAALAALDRLGANERRALLAPVLEAAAEAAYRWAGLAAAASRHSCRAALVELLRQREEAERAMGLDIAAAWLGGVAGSAARAALDEGPSGWDAVRRILTAGVPADARPSLAKLLNPGDGTSWSRAALGAALLSSGDALIQAAAARTFGGVEPAGQGASDAAGVERALGLRTVSVFRALSSEAILALAAQSREWGGGPGEALAVPGEIPALHVLLAGHAELRAGGAARGGLPVRPGAVFGEECLWGGEPLDWTVRCEERCRFASLGGRILATVCMEEPNLLLRLAVAVANRLRELARPPRTTHRQGPHGRHFHEPHQPSVRAPFTEAETLAHLVGLPLLRGCRPESLQALLAAFHTVDIDDGEAAAQAGEQARRLCLVAHGHVVLSVPGTAVSERLGPGDSFGEVALLDARGEPWEARADGHCRLLAADGEAFLAIARADGALLTGLIRALHDHWRDAWETAFPPAPRHAGCAGAGTPAPVRQ